MQRSDFTRQPFESKRVDEVSDEIIYIGVAKAGTDPSMPLWRICQVVKTGTVSATLWAAGDPGQVFAWDDRLTLTYS